MSAHTPGPWRYREWGGLIVGGGAGSDEVLICTMATNTRHDEGRHNRELIIEAPTLRARLDKAEAEVERLRADAERYRWLADKVLACDYGDNDKGCVGWHIRHCKGPAWIAGDSIDAAIDAAIARGMSAQRDCIHGHLARSCELCAAQNDHATACEQIDRLRAENERPCGRSGMRCGQKWSCGRNEPIN